MCVNFHIMENISVLCLLPAQMNGMKVLPQSVQRRRKKQWQHRWELMAFISRAYDAVYAVCVPKAARLTSSWVYRIRNVTDRDFDESRRIIAVKVVLTFNWMQTKTPVTSDSYIHCSSVNTLKTVKKSCCARGNILIYFSDWKTKWNRRHFMSTLKFDVAQCPWNHEMAEAHHSNVFWKSYIHTPTWSGCQGHHHKICSAYGCMYVMSYLWHYWSTWAQIMQKVSTHVEGVVPEPRIKFIDRKLNLFIRFVF